MIADDFRAIRAAMQTSPAPQESRPVPPGFFAWVRETSGGDIDMEIERIRRLGA
jgi:hypothetical protein